MGLGVLCFASGAAGDDEAAYVQVDAVAEQTAPEFDATEQPETSADLAAAVKREICRDACETPIPEDDFSTVHAQRMGYVMSGGFVPPEEVSVAHWWREHTSRFLAQCQQADGHISQASYQSAEGELFPDTDSYDANPISRSAPFVVQESGETADPDRPGVSAASRLRADIRSIKPTLSYALKNIDTRQLPDDFFNRIDGGSYTPRQTSPVVLQWAPTNLHYYPLYFEDPALERYGHSHHPLVQPFASSGRFAVQLLGLPYQMTLHPVCSKEYSLGYYRPGECAPKKHYQIPFNEEATLVEVAVIAGLILIIP